VYVIPAGGSKSRTDPFAVSLDILPDALSHPGYPSRARQSTYCISATGDSLGGVVHLMEVPAPQPGAGRAPATPRRAGPTGDHAPPWREGPAGVLPPMPPRVPRWVLGAGAPAMAAAPTGSRSSPRSATRSSASRSALRSKAWVQSARVPRVNPRRTGLLGASALRGPWACRPLGCVPSANCRPARRRQGEGPGEGGRRSSPPHNPVRPSLPPTGQPTRPDHATG